MTVKYPKGHTPLTTKQHPDNLYINKQAGGHVLSHNPPQGKVSHHGVFPTRGAAVAHIKKTTLGKVYHAPGTSAATRKKNTASLNRMTKMKSMQYTTQQEEHMEEPVVKSFSEFFDDGDTVEKGMKMKKKAKGRGVAKQIGNEMDPHRGKPSGSVFVGPSRGGYKAGAVDRDHARKPHAPRSGVVGNASMKSEGAPTLSKALFPVTDRVQLAVYAGLPEDNALAQNIERQTLHVPPSRNLAMERESGLASQDE